MFKGWTRIFYRNKRKNLDNNFHDLNKALVNGFAKGFHASHMQMRPLQMQIAREQYV
jgi:hypothetical protein